VGQFESRVYGGLSPITGGQQSHDETLPQYDLQRIDVAQQDQQQVDLLEM
jgi:hypothetical protein